MKKHPFILAGGKWHGEGKIQFSASTEQLHFTTDWVIPVEGEGSHETIQCLQIVEMAQAKEEKIQNRFQFFQIKPNSFMVRLENDLVGSVEGEGVIDDTKFAWEFRGHPQFEGFEVYELQKDGTYLFHAEYVSPDKFRSKIEGRIAYTDSRK